MPDGQAPHRVVANILEGLAGGAKSLVGAMKGGVQGVGESIQQALDRPFRAAGGPEHPLRIADRLLDGLTDAAENFVSRGLIGSAETLGEGVARALDQPVQALGFPPSLGQVPRIPSPFEVLPRIPQWGR